jgi:hypothetical protein
VLTEMLNQAVQLLPLDYQFPIDPHLHVHQHQLVVDAVLGQQPTPTPPTPTPGGPDFSKITPDSRGVPKSGVMYTIGQVILFFGLGISFVVLLAGIVTWVGGHLASGIHLSQNAKSHMLRAGFGGILLTTAGGLWTWITSIS